MSTIKANQWLNPDGTENYKCRAWVNFNVFSGVPAIRSSGNVSSITDNGVGHYTVNIQTALLDTNYAPVTSGYQSAQDNFTGSGIMVGTRVISTSTFKVYCRQSHYEAGSERDFEFVHVAVFR